MEQLQTIDADTSMSTPLPVTKFIVEGLLPEGLHILAGSPKVGKSWLALWLCLQRSKGEPVWELPTVRGTILYLCLEDSYFRIQKMNMISGTTGLSGATGSNFVLKRKDRSDSHAELLCTGRDIESRVLELCFQRETHTWALTEPLKKEKVPADPELISLSGFLRQVHASARQNMFGNPQSI